MPNTFMNQPPILHRRTFLRGLGAAMALPMLEAMLPVRSMCRCERRGNRRPAWLSFSCRTARTCRIGRHGENGADFDHPTFFSRSRPTRMSCSSSPGLAQDRAAPGQRRWRRSCAIRGELAHCSQPLKSEGSQIRVGISADQMAAQHRGRRTRFGSIELGLKQAGRASATRVIRALIPITFPGAMNRRR